MDTCNQLDVEPQVKAEVEKLLSELTQLLVGISIMQVGARIWFDERFESHV